MLEKNMQYLLLELFSEDRVFLQVVGQVENHEITKKAY